MKTKKKCDPVVVQRILAILLAISVIANVLLLCNYLLDKEKAEKEEELIDKEIENHIQDGSFIEKDCMRVRLPDCDIYLDRRLNYPDDLTLQTDLGWLYKCKLYKDFGWYPNAYLVYTSIDYVRRNDDKDSDSYTDAYFQTNEGNDYKYIFIWKGMDSSVLHELAHFADSTHDNISQSAEWATIYEKEWKRSTWLLNYKQDYLSDDEQYSRYLKESFAEGFSEWYCEYYKESFSKKCSTEELNNLYLHTVSPILIGVNEDTYPMTFEYMRNFYENYEFNDIFMEAVSDGWTTID